MKELTNNEADLAKFDDQQLEKWLNDNYPGPTIEREGSSIIGKPTNLILRLLFALSYKSLRR